MRRRIAAALVAFFVSCISLYFSPTAAQAGDAKIVLFDAPHTDLLGAALNNELGASLLPIGRLGLPVFAPVAEPRIWLIDAALIDEVTALAVTDLSAQNWLTQLKVASVDDKVFAIAYGHPDLSMAKRLAPSELNYYYDSSKTRLQTSLGRQVLIKRSLRWTNTRIKIASDAVRAY